jgi:hypothetical protein
MTFPEFEEIFKTWKTHYSWRTVQVLTVEQSYEQLNEFVRDYWMRDLQDVVFCDENLKRIIDSCLWNSPIMSSAELLVAARATRDNLRKHTPPQPAPVVVEAAAPQPKLTGSDSLGDGATSVEKPLSTVLEGTPTESTALRDGVDYAWNRSNYNNVLAKLKQQAWNETPLDANGQINHAARQRRYNELKKELDQSIEPKRNDSLQKVHDEAYAKARSAGCTTYAEIERYVNAAVEAAKGK